MLKIKSPLWIVLGMLVLAALACNFSFSTANISNARTASDQDGDNKSETFAPNDVIYAVFDLKNAADNTEVKASWKVVEVEGYEANEELLQSDIEVGSSKIWFSLEPSADGLPEGKYKVDLYLNGDLKKTLTFSVQIPTSNTDTSTDTE